jgi:hypothetical protein
MDPRVKPAGDSAANSVRSLSPPALWEREQTELAAAADNNKD